MAIGKALLLRSRQVILAWMMSLQDTKILTIILIPPLYPNVTKPKQGMFMLNLHLQVKKTT